MDAKFFIELTAAKELRKSEPLFLRGKFNVSYDNAGLKVKGAEVLKHLVLVVTRGGNYQALAPFKNVIVFEDDVTADEKNCSGFFNLNLFEKIDFKGEGEYFVLCSLGVLTSDIVKIIVK